MQDSKNERKTKRETAGLALSATVIYCVCDDLLRAMRHQDDWQCRLSCAEIMRVPMLAALCFGGNSALVSALFGRKRSVEERIIQVSL